MKSKMMKITMKNKFLWWAGLIVALLTAAIGYCSCSVLAITAGKAKSAISTTTTTTTTTSIDSTKFLNRN